MITEEEYRLAKSIVEQYERDEYETKQREADAEVNWMDEDEDEEIEPCSVCGQIEGMGNPCCANYDPLSYKNCGYG